MKTVAGGSLLALSWIAVQPAFATILTFETVCDPAVVESNWEIYYEKGGVQSNLGNAYGDNVDFGLNTTGSTNMVDGGTTWTLNYDKGNGWTPNVTVNYNSESPNTEDGHRRVRDLTNPWGRTWGGVDALDSDSNYPQNPHHSFYYLFTPDPGYEVRVNSFDLINYSNGFAHSTKFTIYKDSIGGPLMVPTYQDNNVPGGASEGVGVHYDLVGASPGSVYYAGTVVLEIEHENGVAWTLALDNLSFDQRPVSGGQPGDFNNDGEFDVLDIDLLCAQIRAGSNDPAFNVNGEGGVDLADLTYEVEQIIGTELGDTDVDTDVDLSDLGNLATNYEQAGPHTWGDGDFDCDEDVDLSDLGTLATNYGAGQAAAYAEFSALTGVEVPEPATVGILAAAAAGTLVNRRQRKRM
jgi:hypothetical protein